MAIGFRNHSNARAGATKGPRPDRQRRLGDIDPDLVVALARQIPSLETDALVRLITSSRPEARISGR
jgi:hypothetical protein